MVKIPFSLFCPMQALSYAGGFGKILIPHLVEKEFVKDDGSVVKRFDNSSMCVLQVCWLTFMFVLTHI